MRVGTGEHTYEVRDNWGTLPDGWSYLEVSGVALDRQDRAYVFNRGKHPVMVFGQDGTFLDSWGDGLFVRPHGIFIGPDDAVLVPSNTNA